MELRASVELGDGRGCQLGEEDTPFIVEEQIQPLSTNSACAARYYRTRGTVLPQGHAVLPHLRRGTTAVVRGTTAEPRGTTAHAAETRTATHALRQRAVVLLVRYYHSPLRYYRKAGAVQGREGTDIKNYIRGYFRRVGVDAKTRRGSTVSQPRYYRARCGCKKLHSPLTAA